LEKAEENIEYRTRNDECRRETGEFDIEERVIDFAVHIITNRRASCQRQKSATTVRKTKLHDSKFLVRYSIFSLKI